MRRPLRRSLLPLLLAACACRVSPPGGEPDDSHPGDTDADADTDVDADTDADTGSGLALVCDSEWTDTPGTLPPVYEVASGARYRVVQLASALLDPLYVAVYFPPDPGIRAYEEGAPVIVTAPPASNVPSYWDRHPQPVFDGDFGVVEVQPVYPGWSVQGLGTEGPPDAGGVRAAESVVQAVRFAAGLVPSVEGWSVGQVAGMDVCHGDVPLMGLSAGGTPAMTALVVGGEDLVENVPLFVNYETTSLPQFTAGDPGAVWMDADTAVDADGNGCRWDDGRHPGYRVGDCTVRGCTLDLSSLAWTDAVGLGDLWPGLFSAKGARGILYLDRNGNGALDLAAGNTLDLDGDGAIDGTEDFVLSVHEDTGAGGGTPTSVYSVEALQAAVAAGVLDVDAWPAHVRSLPDTLRFWSSRNLMYQADLASRSYPTTFRLEMVYTEEDHAQALHDRPHVTLLADLFLDAGFPVRYNMTTETAECCLRPGTWAGFSGGPPPNTRLGPDDLDAYAIPETALDNLARACAAIGAMGDLWGPVDRCAQGQ